ncbi:MAG TPA: cupin domain-containing protein [Pyrinomonadaceae bacterium]|jgi:quercetin dioxygenase-like cupin family protein|nr:cupin domain-containing protein [Pyrinomonadaceae bacterium]
MIMHFYDLNHLENEEVTSFYLRKAIFGESLTIARVEVKKGETTQPHSHDTEEVILVLKGAWQFHLPDGTMTLRENQVLLIPAGVEHSSEVLEDTIALDICSKQRRDWILGKDKSLHQSVEQFLWAV